MNPRRALAFSRRILAQFRHDRRTLGFVLMMPLLMMLLFGYTFGGEPKGLNVAVVNMDETQMIPGYGNFSLSDMILENLDRETFVLSYYHDLDGALADLRDAKTCAVLFFPTNFSGNLVMRVMSPGNTTEPARIGLHLDDSDPNIANAIVKGISRALQTTQERFIDVFNLSVRAEPVVIESTREYAGKGDIRFIDYFAPGIIAFAIMMVTTMLTIILFVNERRTGTLDRLLASTARETEIVIGYALAFAVVGIIQSTVILTAAMILFDISIAGNVALALLVVMLIAFGHQGLGILLSSAAKNELQAIQFVPLILFPSVLLAGLFWPVQSIPKYLQPLSYFIPLRYGIDAERAIMIRGWGINEIWPDIAVLILFAFLTLGCSILMLKRRG